MLGWIEKVVPQPPVSSRIPVVVEKDAKVAESPVGASYGFARLKQQPEGSPRNASEGPVKDDSVGTQDRVSTTESTGRGVLTWLSEGLGKVMPQPTQNSVTLQETLTVQEVGQSFEASFDIPDVTEVQSIHDDEEDAIEILDSDDEENFSELQSSSDNNCPDKSGKKVISWLMEGFGKMVPQPENMKKNEERTTKENTSKGGSLPTSPPSTSGAKHGASLDSQSGLSVSLFPRSLGGNGGSIFGWVVQGLEKVLPQPVSQTNEQNVEAECSGPGQDRSKGA